MYDPDQKTIAAYARQSPHNLRQVGLFVQATINQHFEIVPQIMESFRLEGRDSKFLSHQKRRSFDALTSEAKRLFDDVMAYDPGTGDRLAMLLKLVQLPGFGIVKAGFWCQLVLGDIGCLDRHNLRQAGLREGTFTRIPASVEGLYATMRTYVATCDMLGGSAVLWNGWCTALSTLRPTSFPTAEDVSKFHVSCICKDTP